MENVLILLMGGFLVALSRTSVFPAQSWGVVVLQTLGVALIGYPVVALVKSSGSWIRRWRAGTIMTSTFRHRVQVETGRRQLPVFIASDIEGCITPHDRSELDLRRFSRLRTYCEFVTENREYPPLVFFTGRSQGYTELLAQSLGLLDMPLSLPFVIENGAALYHPESKTTSTLIGQEQIHTIQDAQKILGAEFSKNEFEPKSYMITINNRKGYESIEELRDKVIGCLGKAGLKGELAITSTASAVDITSYGVNKLSGLMCVVRLLPADRAKLCPKAVVACGDSVSDQQVLEYAGKAYCPAENVSPELLEALRRHEGGNALHLNDIDFVVRAIEIECGLRII